MLHENPLVDKLVGVLGSITQRKVSEIFTVQKVKQCDLKANEKRPDLPDIYFRVKQVKARGRDVSDWLFEYVTNAGGWGQPVEINDNGTKVVNTREMEFIKEADERFSKLTWTSAGLSRTEVDSGLTKQGVTSNRRKGMSASSIRMAPRNVRSITTRDSTNRYRMTRRKPFHLTHQIITNQNFKEL